MFYIFSTDLQFGIDLCQFIIIEDGEGGQSLRKMRAFTSPEHQKKVTRFLPCQLGSGHWLNSNKVAQVVTHCFSAGFTFSERFMSIDLFVGNEPTNPILHCGTAEL